MAETTTTAGVPAAESVALRTLINRYCKCPHVDQWGRACDCVASVEPSRGKGSFGEWVITRCPVHGAELHMGFEWAEPRPAPDRPAAPAMTCPGW